MEAEIINHHRNNKLTDRQGRKYNMNKIQFGMKKDYYKRRQRENLARKRQHKT